MRVMHEQEEEHIIIDSHCTLATNSEKCSQDISGDIMDKAVEEKKNFGFMTEDGSVPGRRFGEITKVNELVLENPYKHLQF